jgi:hypothetical protein
MPSSTILTEEALFQMLDTSHHATIKRWLDRGDGVAVYENQDLGSPRLGHQQFMSYGSPAAQIETAEPPERCPDMVGRAPNWAYLLVGTCKREGSTSASRA